MNAVRSRFAALALLIAISCCATAPVAFGATPSMKLDPRLTPLLASGAEPAPVWVEFADKGETGPSDLAARLAAAEANLTPEARRRREPAASKRDELEQNELLQGFSSLVSAFTSAKRAVSHSRGARRVVRAWRRQGRQLEQPEGTVSWPVRTRCSRQERRLRAERKRSRRGRCSLFTRACFSGEHADAISPRRFSHGQP